jgi:hypothetical protein
MKCFAMGHWVIISCFFIAMDQSVSAVDTKVWKSERDKARKFLEERKLNEADQAYKNMLAAAEVFSEKDTQLIETLLEVADFYRWTGRPVLAEPLAKRALAAVEANWGKSDARAFSCLLVLGRVSTSIANFDVALAQFKRAEQIAEKKAGKYSPFVADALLGIADIQAAQKEDSAAEATLKEALSLASSVQRRSEMRQKEDPAINPMSWTIYETETDKGRIVRIESRLGRVQFAAQKYKEAEETYADLVKNADRHLKRDDPVIIEPLADLAFMASGRGDHKKAEGLIQRAAKLGRNYYETAPEKLGTLLLVQANILDAMGKKSEAEKIREEGKKLFWEPKLRGARRF